MGEGLLCKGQQCFCSLHAQGVVCSYRLNFEQGYRLNFDQAFLPRVIAAAVDKSIPDFLFPTVLQPEASISISAGKAVQGEARNGVTCAGRGQNGSASLAFSRALIRDFAVAVLCRKRYDSLPVSMMWQ